MTDVVFDRILVRTIKDSILPASHVANAFNDHQQQSEPHQRKSDQSPRRETFLINPVAQYSHHGGGDVLHHANNGIVEFFGGTDKPDERQGGDKSCRQQQTGGQGTMVQECKAFVSAQVEQVSGRKWQQQQRFNEQSLTATDMVLK